MTKVDTNYSGEDWQTVLMMGGGGMSERICEKWGFELERDDYVYGSTEENFWAGQNSYKFATPKQKGFYFFMYLEYSVAG